MEDESRKRGPAVSEPPHKQVKDGESEEEDADADNFKQPSCPNPDDFVWQWRLKRIEGDVDKFMADAGTNWALRKMAKQMNYGIR